MTTAATEPYEQRLWDELNSLLADAVPEGASESQAEDAILLAVMGHDSEIHALYEQVKRLARDRAGYLRERQPGRAGPTPSIRTVGVAISGKRFSQCHFRRRVC